MDWTTGKADVRPLQITRLKATVVKTCYCAVTKFRYVVMSVMCYQKKIEIIITIQYIIYLIY